MGYVYWIKRKKHLDIMKDGYVGVFKGKNVKKRWKDHNRAAQNNSNLTIHKAIRKYSDLEYTVIFFGNYNECLKLEEFYRPNVNIGWNICRGGNKGSLGRKQSKEAKEKISMCNKGRICSEETKQKLRETSTGRKHSSESIEKCRASKIGHIVSEETRQKIREANIGKKYSNDTKTKQSKTRINKAIKPVNIYSYETKELIKSNVCMASFCRENNICMSQLAKTAKGKFKYAKGYFAVYC